MSKLTILQKLEAFTKLHRIYKKDVDEDNPGESYESGLCAVISDMKDDGVTDEQENKYLLKTLKTYMKSKTYLFDDIGFHSVKKIRQSERKQNVNMYYAWPKYKKRPRLRWIREQIKRLEKDVQFIIVSDERPAKNFKGEIIGTTPKRALFWSKDVGQHRAYRASFELPENQALSMVMFKFDNKKEAQELCKGINEAYNDDFKLEAILK